MRLPDSLLLPRRADERLLSAAFHPMQILRMFGDFGAEPDSVCLTDEGGCCRFTALCDDHFGVAARWLEALASRHAEIPPTALHKLLILNYAAIPTGQPNTMEFCLRSMATYFRDEHYTGILSKCESLRHLRFWRRHGAQVLTKDSQVLPGPAGELVPPAFLFYDLIHFPASE